MLTDSQRAALAARLRRGRGEDAAGRIARRIARRPPDLVNPPASFGQEQLWFIDRFAPGQPTYNIPHTLRLSGPLDAGALGRALDSLVARHEALRTRLVTDAGGLPVQVIDPPRSLALEVTDLSGLEPDKRQARLREFIAAEAVRPFTLAEGPLLRAWLLRLGSPAGGAGPSGSGVSPGGTVSPQESTEHLLLAVMHHAVFDGWSARVLVRELAALYGQEAGGEPSGLAELPVQFADYAVWERDRLRGVVLEELEGYWRGVMEGFGTVQFPADRPRPALDSFEGGLAVHMTGPGLLGDLRELSRREGTTLFVTLMAALHALLSRYTGQTDLVVGTVSANRGKSELAPLIGFLVNTLPIRGDLSGDPAFTELLAQVRETTVGAYAHQDLPYARLVETLRVERDPGRAPIFQIALTYAERDAAPVLAAGVEFVMTDLIVGIDAAKFDLDFTAEARPGGLWFECSYKTGLFDAGTVRRLLGNFEVLLRGVAADPSARLSRLPVLTGEELRRELVAWNDTAAVFPAVCIHQGFEARMAGAPGPVAAEFGDARVSYAELNRQANRVARWLRVLGVGPEVLVGVCMEAGLRRLAGLLGIWKAGGGYVPLDPALPAERLSFMMADTGMTVVLTDEPSAGRLPGFPPAGGREALSAQARSAVTVVSLDADWAAISALEDSGLADAGVVPSNVAYVIYTSGSTGQPKGAVVEHRQAINFLHGMIGHWQIGPSDRVLQFASLSFDASVQEMFMPLLGGARVILAPTGTLHSPPRLAALIRDRRVTFACLTPSVVSLLGEEQFPDLRVLMCGGEELPSELARHWTRPGLRFVNDYGPTETTITATFMELDDGTQLPPPIGWPMANCRAYVLDADLNPVPVGVIGELHIGGAGVARGYLNRPELTAQRFIPDPLRADPAARLYKTGDLVRRRPDGSIVFTGRADGQVKILGLRVETGEIEAALAAHPAVAQAVVTVVTDPAGDKQLAAYLRPEPGAAQVSGEELRDHLARTLPAYMIPAYLITVDTFPINISGKIDRSALPAPDHVQAATGHTAPAGFSETILAGLYATVLNREQVGATDSFFDIGGSSLQAMRLISMISNEVGVDIGVTEIFLHPTPRQLAASIDAIRSGARQYQPGGTTLRAPQSPPRSAGSGPLAELSAGTGELPLFLIHAVAGTVFAYAQLARELAGTFRVYGLEAPGLHEAGATMTSLAGLVRDYTNRIRAAQPAGPYRLAGWSMGGTVAFEIARQLEEVGAEVSLLALLDAPFALPDTHLPAQAQLAAQFLADATYSLGWDTVSLPDPATSTAADQLAWLARRLAVGEGHSLGGHSASRSADAVAARIRHRFDVFQAHTRMLAGYQPAAPAVRAPTMIVSASDSPNAPASAHWPRVLGGPVATLRTGGDHYSFLRPPLVTEIGTSILKWHGGSDESTVRENSGSGPSSPCPPGGTTPQDPPQWPR